MGAFTVGICMAMSAFAVDYGFYYLQSRKLQGIADVAALAAAGDLDNAERAVRRAVQANGWEEPFDVEIEVGNYTPDPALDEFPPLSARRVPRNAARVRPDQPHAALLRHRHIWRRLAARRALGHRRARRTRCVLHGHAPRLREWRHRQRTALGAHRRSRESLGDGL